jgi:predicted transcriptional regulator
MSTAKESMIEILARQPDDSSYDTLLRELAYARMIQRGLEDSAKGKTVSNEDAKREIESWRR